MKKILLLFTIITPLFLLSQINQITVEEAQEMLAGNTVLVDVRENTEVEELAYAVENILYIPLSELSSRYKELPSDKTLLIACRTGNRSKKAINQLSELGVDNTVNLEGGILEWQTKGYPVIANGVAPSEKTSCTKRLR